MEDSIHFTIGKICFTGSSLIFAIKEVLSTLLLKLQYSFNKGALIHLRAMFFMRVAFNSINHEILLDKLKKYGVSGVCLKWFESYCKELTQCIQVNDVLSAIFYLPRGVPQDSLFGRLKFLNYIKDLPSAWTFPNAVFLQTTRIFSIVRINKICFS